MTLVCVIGGGVVGLSCAWALARAGCSVDVVDPQPGRGASHAAAGMLAPISEAVHGERDALALGLRSLAQWPDFARRLEADSEVDLGLRGEGTLLVAHDRDDADELRRFAGLLERLALGFEPLTGRQARRQEPALSPRTVAGLLVPTEKSVDNRALVRALLSACRKAGVRLHAGRAIPVSEGNRVAGVLTEGKDFLPADIVVVAAGCSSGEVAHPTPRHATRQGERGALRGDGQVRPVKGQILRLHGRPGLLRHTIRARVAGQQVYLVPRDSGEVVVGATSEDIGPDTRVTALAVHDLLHAALAVVPEVRELEVVDVMAGLRPASPDNAPLIGSTDTDGLLLATAHFRGGVLLAPATAEAITAMALGAAPDPLIARLSPQRLLSRSPSSPQEASA